jgi:hypothetical protein
VQTKWLDLVSPGWRAHGVRVSGLRELFLKARQMGLTTLIEAALFLDTLNNDNTETVVIAHDLKTTQAIFRIVRRFYENLPDDVRPVARYASKREFFWPEIGSSFYVGTAGAREFGRGTTVTNVHGSEVAFWPDGESIVSGLLEAVPASGNIVLESTANGLGGYFHSEWEAFENGDSEFTGRFFAWFEHGEYVEPVEPGFVKSSEETAMAEQHGLSDGQVAFYRRKRRALRGKVKREYPATAREAFLATGVTYYDQAALEAADASVSPPLPDPPVPPGLVGRVATGGQIEVWSVPAPGRRYVVSVDTAEGLDRTGREDFCCADVVDADSFEQVAQVHGRWEPHEFGLLVAELGAWFGGALIAVERNNHGHATLAALIHTALVPLAKQSGRWGGVYQHEEYDAVARRVELRPGWPTNVKTKYLALDALGAVLMDGSLVVRSAKTARELGQYRKLPGGKAGGAVGSHDDRVTSLSIAAAVLAARRPRSWATDPRALDRLYPVPPEDAPAVDETV